MSTGETVLLAAIAGATIFLGLPIGRMRFASKRVRTFLNGLSAGILVFLFMETAHAATEGVEIAMDHVHEGTGSLAHVAVLSLVYVVGFGAGLLGLMYTSRLARRVRPSSVGPGAMAATEAAQSSVRPDVTHDALRLGMSIAIGIGLHNFSEGLAIGAAASAGAVSLAILLVIGFALHNATEGFGIVGPLAAVEVRPSWGWLGLAGLIAGGPTFVGALLGSSVTSPTITLLFFAMAAGAILYVVGELFAAGKRLSWSVTVWGIFVGVVIAAAMELVLAAAGM